ncbi:uncharacterized protein LOC129681482 [Psammomys obesus]|uniref:uncharacterized protein LOC129681482 n=1 Tax=Psammomys obesus TaxID=48139 RepID=UPI0024535A3E|nr:uncharacterized protein LOC129681482 [Psammomys obesus]
MDQNSSGLQSKETAAPHSLQNETQDSMKVTSSLPDATQGHQVDIQAPVPIIHTRGRSIQEPSVFTPMIRRVSIQEPPASMFLPHKFSTQISSSPIILPRRISTPESFSQSIQSNTQDIQSVAYNRWLSSRASTSFYCPRRLDVLSSHTLCSVQSVIQNFQTDTESHPSLIHSQNLNRKRTRPSVDVPTSLTYSPEASIRSFESFIWESTESLKELSHDSLSNPSSLSSRHKLPSTSTEITLSSLQRRRWSLFPMGWRLLLEAKKISRYLSLVLTVAGMVMLTSIALWQPWIHFQVPLVAPGDPTGPKTIPIDTIFFMRCPDISCMNEYDKNAYLLDLAWACLLVSGITSFCVCMGLISTIFFPGTNLPLMDFSLFICSLTTGTSIILGVLFYLMQARKFLQEGMTYTLGSSFYLAWINVFLFSMTGLFSYLNYMNFWSILRLQAMWS